MLDQLAAVHMKGVFFLTQSLLPLIADGGRIVNLSSELTRFSFPGYAAYVMMKGGVEVFTRYLAKELGPRKTLNDQREYQSRNRGCSVPVYRWDSRQRRTGLGLRRRVSARNRRLQVLLILGGTSATLSSFSPIIGCITGLFSPSLMTGGPELPPSLDDPSENTRLS